MNFGQFIKEVRRVLIDSTISNVDLVNAVIENEVDVPSILREAMQIVGIEKGIIGNFEYFVEDYIDQYQIKDFIKRLSVQIDQDEQISKEERKKILEHSNEPHEFLALLYIAVIKTNNKENRKKDEYLYSNGKNYVKVIAGDIFKYGFSSRNKIKRIIVIPVDTTFDTHLSTNIEKEMYPRVSIDTLHGEWLLRLKKRQNDMKDIESRIRENLKLQQIDLDAKSNAPIGTIALIEEDNTTFYLLAISRFDDFNNAQSNLNDIKEALKMLLEFYNRKGQGYPLYMPLIGTGMSRAGLSYQVSYNLIKECALNMIKTKQGKINIVLLPEVMNYIDL